jgi:hypothetical protein
MIQFKMSKLRWKKTEHPKRAGRVRGGGFVETIQRGFSRLTGFGRVPGRPRTHRWWRFW